MTFDLLHLLHQALFGALAASGFGILFNFGWRELPWCAASGAMALATRTLGQDAGCTVEAASFTAAVAVGCAGRVSRARLGIASTALAVSRLYSNGARELRRPSNFRSFRAHSPAP